MKTLLSRPFKAIFRSLFSGLLLFAVQTPVSAQPATVTYPLAVGRTGCTSGTQQVHFYTYNGTTNTLASINATAGVTGYYTPQLRIGTSGTSAQRFTANYSSISYNPADHNIYFLWTALTAFSGSGSVPRTYVWRWPVGTKPTGTAPRLDTLCSFPADLLGVAFDNDGNSYVIEFSGEPSGVPHTAYLRSIDFTTRQMGPVDNLILTGGATIYESGSGDVAISPSGQMFFVVNNKLFTPNYKSYTGTGANLTCTYIDTVQVPSNNFVGLTYAQGETIAAFSGGAGPSACPFREIDPLTGDTSVIIKPGTVYSAADLASVVSGVGSAKRLVSAIPTGTPNQYDVVYEVTVKNYGNTDISNVQVTDNLTAINGAVNLSAVTTSFVSNPAGLVLNAGFNGNSDINLLNGTGTLPNYPVANNYAVIQINCRLSGIINGFVYNNSAIATAVGYNAQSLRDSSTNGSVPDLNINDKPDDAGEGQPTPLIVSITGSTLPCTALANVLYSQDFGSGAGLATAIPAPVPGSGVVGATGSATYAGSVIQPLATERYTITDNTNTANNAHFVSMTDHTGNANGRMLVVNADASNSIFYRGAFTAPICANQQYSLSLYAAFVGNASYQTLCNGFGGFQYPKILVNIKDQASGAIISSLSTGDIFTTSWQQLGIKFTSPASYTGIIFELINNAPGGCGNDIAIDDIQFGSCDPLPVVGLNHINAGCLGTTASFSAVFSDPGAILGTPDYQWQESPDGVSWSDIAAAPNADTYTIASVAAGDVNKYYRALVAAAGNLGNPNCRYPSPSFFLVAGCDIDDDDDGIPDTVESGGVDPLDDDDLDHIPNYRDTDYPGFIDSNGDGVNDNFDWDLDGIINELDLDSDNDGIPDVVEAGGVDTDGDGKIDNYTDVDNDGFSQNVDANTSGKDLSGSGLGLPDLDGDGIPNYLDLDSDNDGIPDVVEVYGTDITNDGMIDAFIDTDNDGLSDQADGDVGNDGIAENAAAALLRTGTDPDNNGRANTFPYNNMDGDSKSNPYDLDSDGDGISDVRESGFTDGDWNGQVDGAINAKGRNILLAALGSLAIPDSDATGRSNPYDIDSDDDGIPDNVEGLTTLGYLLPSGVDTDSDGLDNSYDNYSGFGGDGIHVVDTDGDTIPDYLDDDTDGDGSIDRIEGNDLNLNGQPDDLVTLTGTDTDGDGLDDRFDANNFSAEATSARMGNGGTITGDATPGSITTVQHTTVAFGCATERDWRCLPYILSCEIIRFKALLQHQQVQLDWSAFCRQEVEYFIVERSTDQSRFEPVLRVQGRATVNETESYTGTDIIAGNNAPVIYYRLRSVMRSGRQLISAVIAVRMDPSNLAEVRILPNPVRDQLQLSIVSVLTTPADIIILDANNRLLMRFSEQVRQGKNILLYPQTTELPEGVYFLRIVLGEDVLTRKFTKLK
ncbi:MAG TPA: T9SS type A sorting domain-containing protein [Chitinophagaceae bacterium]|nr:T9SS type A sorting domain-containing protein [Chitinophagaceae bacterium]